MSSPPPDIHYGDNEPSTSEPKHQSPVTPLTRTVAIIKTHALAHRFDVEKRIQEASFEIVKERQMEFDTETDPETLYELFGEDADSFAEGPVWVYVLERRRAVEVWNTLMGDRDPEVARHDSPNSLRALYGHSYHKNGVMGSSDNHIAEIQISSLFVSSPPFPTSELPSEDRYATMSSVSSSVMDALRKATSDEGYAPSTTTNPSTANGGSQGRLNLNGKVLFKARPVPVTNEKPDIVPRTTRAAALRAGHVVEKVPSAPRAPVSKERLAATFANVPGHKRATTIAVASTAPPTIAPRMTRAASLRLGQPAPPPPVRKRAVTNGDMTKHGPSATFEGVPGHKRRESIAVASAKAPSVAPRLNKSAALRAQKEQAPPTSFMFKTPIATKTPSLSRTSSRDTLSPPRQLAPRPASQASILVSPSKPKILHNRASSVLGTTRRTTLAPKANGTATMPSTKSDTTTPVAKPRPRPSSIAAPSIAPKTNRSAALRAAKQEAENAAAAAAAATRKGPRPSKVPPSSFKAVAA